jgi:hypothetical protein
MIRIFCLVMIIYQYDLVHAELPASGLFDVGHLEDFIAAQEIPKIEPLIKVKGNQVISADRIESMVHSSSSWSNWLSMGSDRETLGEIVQSLEKELEVALLANGYPGAVFKLNLFSSPKNYGIMIELNEGDKSEFLGFETPSDLPSWLKKWSEAFLGIYEESIEASLKKTTSWRCQKGEVLETHSGGFFTSLSGQRSSGQSWFGDADLLSPSKQKEEFFQPGFFLERANLAQMRLIESLKSIRTSLSPNNLHDMLKRESDLQLLLGCEGARRGYPSIKSHFSPVMKKGGYVIRLQLKGFDTPLSFAGLRIVGMSQHSAKEIENWILLNCNLKLGQILKTKDMVNLRRSLLESCSFHDVGVWPLGLSGSCELLVSLRDEKELPKLGMELTSKQELARKVANLLFRKPKIRLNYHSDQIELLLKADLKRSLFLLEFLDVESRLLATLYLFDGYLGLSVGPEFIPIGKVALNGSLQFTVGASLVPEQEKKKQFFMGVGFNTLRVPSNLYSYITPGILLHGYKQEGFWLEDLSEDNGRWNYTNKEGKVEIVDDPQKGIRVNYEFPSFSNSSETLDFSILETLILPNESLLIDCPTFSSDKLESLLRLSLEKKKIKSSIDLDEKKLELATVAGEKILLPKVFQILSRFIFDEEANVPASSGRSNMPVLTNEDIGLNWPNLLSKVGLAALSQDRRGLVENVEVVLNSERPGPIGNLVYAALCNSLVSRSMASNFLLNAQMTNFSQDFVRDLHYLELINGIFDFLVEVQRHPNLRLEMEKLGFDPLKLELFLDQKSNDLNLTVFEQLIQLEVEIHNKKEELTESIQLNDMDTNGKNVLSSKIKKEQAELTKSLSELEQSLYQAKLSRIEFFVTSFWDDLIEPKMNSLIDGFSAYLRTNR